MHHLTKSKHVRTRIAPSPTGYPHIGTIYQALFNFAYAKKNNGRFLVRIEDTDRIRFVEGSEVIIFSTLDWFGLIEDESIRKEGDFGPYRQSERLSIYHKYVQELLDKGYAYYSYYLKKDAGVKKDYTQKEGVVISESLTAEEPEPPKSIQEMIEIGNWVIRMRVPKGKPVKFHDEIRGDITFDASQVTEQVLIKSDGFPTYHLAVVVDDHLMQISHIVRGEEWISSTPKHVLLYDYFGWEIPLFFHTPDLRNPDKSKLSKRHGHTDVTWYQNEGFLPETILNYLALLGWSHPEEKEIFSLEEFTKLFDLKDIKPAGPVFDLKKLTWMNGEYIRMISDKSLIQKLKKFYKKKNHKEVIEFLDSNSSTKELIIGLAKTRMNTLADFAGLIEFLFKTPSIILIENEKVIAKNLYQELKTVQVWQKEKIFSIMKALLLKYKMRMSFFYKLFTGKENGLPLPETIEILGKEKALSYLEKAI